MRQRGAARIDLQHPIAIVEPLEVRMSSHDDVCRHAFQIQLEQVLDAWKQIRGSFPEELQPAFDTLHQLRSQNSPDYAANAARTVKYAQELVKKHFSKSLMSRLMEFANS